MNKSLETLALRRALQFDREPGPRVRPPLLGGGHRDAECGSGLLEIQADKVTQLDQFRLAFIDGGQFFQRLVQGEQLIVLRQGRRYFESIQVNDLDTCAAFCRKSSPGVFDQDATHRLGCRAEEMRSIVKGRSIGATQPHPCLVDEGGGLKCMADEFAGHLPRCQTPEFFVNDREKFGGGFCITLFHPFQNMRELAQAFRIGKRLCETTSNANTLQPKVRGNDLKPPLRHLK